MLDWLDLFYNLFFYRCKSQLTLLKVHFSFTFHICLITTVNVLVSWLKTLQKVFNKTKGTILPHFLPPIFGSLSELKVTSWYLFIKEHIVQKQQRFSVSGSTPEVLWDSVIVQWQRFQFHQQQLQSYETAPLCLMISAHWRFTVGNNIKHAFTR